MFLKTPKNSEKYQWTQHSIYKMKQYGLSPQRVLRVIRAPERIEKGIVEKTIAVMQPASTRIKNGKKIWSQEIWAMYQPKVKSSKLKVQSEIKNSKVDQLQTKNYKLKTDAKPQLRIISAWRYPGISPKNNPIPEEILREIKDAVR